MKYEKSEQLLSKSQEIFPGGVNSPVRSFRSVGGHAFVAKRGEGAYLYDVDGNRYVDLVCSWGALIHGHNHPKIARAVTEASKKGTSFGVTCEYEIELGEKVKAGVPGLDRLRLVNSGTEACMSAIRLARGATGRDLIIKFEGQYHGHADSFLVGAGSGVAQFGHADSGGVTQKTVSETLVLPFNDVQAVQTAFATQKNQIAAIIMEVVCGNMGVVKPEQAFLSKVRELTRSQSSLLIFDEVMTGFRLGYEGSQRLYGIQPDLFTFGKIIGGGFPVAAYGGKEELMRLISPLGPVYQAGTLSGNPIGCAAGSASLDQIKENEIDFYQNLDSKASEWKSQLDAFIQQKGYPVSVVQCGSMLSVFFSPNPPKNFSEVQKSDTAKFKKFFWNLLENGVYFPPSAFESCFLSAAHTDEIMEEVSEASCRALAKAFDS